MLDGEIIKVIEGTSVLKPEMLNKKYEEAQITVAEKRKVVERFESEMEDTRELKRKIQKQYSDVLNWADIFATSPMDVKKMIVTQLIGAVRVSQDYKIEIDFKISAQQLGLEREIAPVKKPKRNNDISL